LEPTGGGAEVLTDGVGTPRRGRGAADPARTARYQWRAWGDLPASRALLAGLGGEPRVEHRRDVYLLGTRPSHNVKVRQRRLEVNVLLGEVAGFQLWTRAALHPLPGGAGILHDALDRAVDRPLEEHLLDEFAGRREPGTGPVGLVPGTEVDRLGRRKLLQEAVRRGLLPVAVTKERVRFRFGADRAEVTTVTIEQPAVQVRCIAIEGRDLRRLVALRTRLGLDETVNLPVPAALEALLDNVAAAQG